MYRSILSKKQRTLSPVIAAIAMAASALFPSIACAGGDGKSTAPSEKAPAVQAPSGAELYAINCNRCHEERYPKEFTLPQWTTLMLHMRVRANLTAAESKKILKYLQSQSGK